MPSLLITVPSISSHDAVSNDAWEQQKFFQNLGWDVFIYSELPAVSVRSHVISLNKMRSLIKDPNTQWIYHHGVFWQQGEDLLGAARCKVHLRYHNITPPEFFQKYDDHVATFATKNGLQQTQRFVCSKIFHSYLGASKYNCDELVEMGAGKSQCRVIAPFFDVKALTEKPLSPEVEQQLASKPGVNILFVGRVAPNKGHLHLIETINQYVGMFGKNVRLHIAGSLSCAPNRYIEKMRGLVAKYRLGDQIVFWGSAGLKELHTLYNKCDVFLVMSEHEGFCVPIIEAQAHELPIIALNRTAVKETLGENQLCFDALDYKKFAAAIQWLSRDEKSRRFLKEHGLKNQKRFNIKDLGTQLKAALNQD